MKRLAAILLFACAAHAAGRVVYRLDSVRRTVRVNDVAAAKGASAVSGDRVETGWFSSTTIADAEHKASFELSSRTLVTLASDEPGVILSLERGKLDALFDKLTGSEPRIVKTPGALLAVRGTEYVVEVQDDGTATIDVVEGVVEVRSALAPQPILVRAGQSSTFSRRTPPNVQQTPPQRRRDDQNRSQRNNGAHNGDRNNGAQQPPPQRGTGDDRHGGGGHGMPAPPPPSGGAQPPPHRPPASL